MTLHVNFTEEEFLRLDLLLDHFKTDMSSFINVLIFKEFLNFRYDADQKTLSRHVITKLQKRANRGFKKHRR